MKKILLFGGVIFVILLSFFVFANLTINLLTPNSLISNSLISFNFSISSNADNCSLYHNVSGWSLIDTKYNLIEGNNFFEQTIDTEGSFIWNVMCYNDSIPYSAALNQSFTLDLNSPVISLSSPANDFVTNNIPVVFSYHVFDVGFVNSCSIFINNVLNTTSSTITNNAQNYFSINLAPANYTWRIECNDSFNRVGVSNTFNLQVRGDLIWSPEILNLGSTHSNGGALSSTASLEVINYNKNIDISCVGDCSVITNNFISSSDVRYNELLNIEFSCSSSIHGNYLATFNATSDEFLLGDIITVDCSIYEAKADLYLNNSLFYYDGILVEGEEVLLKLDVYNIGDVDAENVEVLFYDYDDSIINSNIINVLSGGFFTTSTLFNVSSGNRTIKASVNQGQIIDEYSFFNNEALLDINVSSWHTLTGNVSGRFVLQDGSENTVYEWPKEIVEGSILYVVDADSSIDWASLRAISRDSTGSLRLDDFSQADIALNISSHNDNLQNTFGASFESDNFTLFDKLVENVPIHAHGSDFFTGVVWDYSSDTDGFFGGADKEDLIFFTRLSNGSVSEFGVVDYQIKFIANLRQYVVPNNNNNVAIYVELK